MNHFHLNTRFNNINYCTKILLHGSLISGGPWVTTLMDRTNFIRPADKKNKIKNL